MNRFRIVALPLILCVFSFLSACQHEEDELSEPETILTLQVGPNAYLGGDNWVFATNDNGEVLDVKPFTKGETVTLSSTQRLDNINVTFLQVHMIGPRSCTFSTYAAVAKGTTWSMEASVYRDPPPEGVATFKVSDYEEPLNALRFSNTVWYDNQYSGTNANTLVVDVSLREVSGDVLLSGYRSGLPVCNWAKGVQVGDLVERNFLTDFDAFPHQVKLDFEGTNSGSIIGKTLKYPFGTELINSSRLIGTKWDTDRPVIGYVDGFDSYEISVSNVKTNGMVSYHKIGEPDLSFSIPTFTFSFNNTDRLVFSFNFSEPYTYSKVNWNYSDAADNIAWSVVAPPGQTVKGFGIPDEITAKYGAIDLSKLQYHDISFTQFVEGKAKSYPVAVAGIVGPDADRDFAYYVYRPR